MPRLHPIAEAGEVSQEARRLLDLRFRQSLTAWLPLRVRKVVWIIVEHGLQEA
jgi:hypothetical protein